jgi:hypothetical protein
MRRSLPCEKSRLISGFQGEADIPRVDFDEDVVTLFGSAILNAQSNQ